MLSACQESQDLSAPCQGAKMTLLDTTGKITYLQVMNSSMLRQHNDSGGYKIFSLDAMNDSIHLYFNVQTDLYPPKELPSDDLPYQSFTYPNYNSVSKGQISLQFSNGNWLQSTPTDTSSITIKSIDLETHKISGYYYFALHNRTMKGGGLFTSICFLSSK